MYVPSSELEPSHLLSRKHVCPPPPSRIRIRIKVKAGSGSVLRYRSIKKLNLKSHETFPLTRFLERALALNQKYHGARSLKVAVSFHLVARTQSCMGDFRYIKLSGADPDYFPSQILDLGSQIQQQQEGEGDRKFVVFTSS